MYVDMLYQNIHDHGTIIFSDSRVRDTGFLNMEMFREKIKQQYSQVGMLNLWLNFFRSISFLQNA